MSISKSMEAVMDEMLVASAPSKIQQSTQLLFIQVAVPVPMNQTFDYALSPSFQFEPAKLIGCRVLVPFGRQKLIGIVVSAAPTHFDPDKIKPIYQLLDTQPFIDASLLKLAHWCSEYYFHPLGEVLATMVPTQLRQGQDLERYTNLIWQPTLLGEVTDLAKLTKSSSQQSKALQLLLEHQHLSQSLLKSFNIKRATLEALVKKGLVTVTEPKSTAKPAAQVSRLPPLLTPEQIQVITAINAATGTHLLFGVTGSGKTEVYMQLMQTALAKGQQVLILVPEIGLTPQTLARFQKRFQATIAVLHSKQSDTQRAEHWLLASTGEADFVIGTRSAVFTPLPRLGLIIIDEEHDQSYKQQEGMRYSARDIAILRASWLGISAVLGSATPSLESLYNVQYKQFHLHHLQQRATGVDLPELNVVDLRRETCEQGIAQSVLKTIGTALQQGQQVMVFLNRRGFAPAVICNDCGWTAQCNRCDAKLTLHRQAFKMRCHHCEYQTKTPKTCPMCNSEHLNPHGKGTERVEETLTANFKQAVLRIDRDTMTTQKIFQQCLNKINTGEALILLGTQMLAKGHDFAGVQLVVILDIDAGLFSSDFRAEEKISQMLTQVTGRAGRAQTKGKVLVQTFQPHHQVFQLWHGNNYQKTADYLLEQRQNAGLPPFSFHILIRAEATKADKAKQFLMVCRNILLDCLRQTERLDKVQLLGPVNANMERRAGVHRFHLLLQAAVRKDLHSVLRHCHGQILTAPESRQVRWSLDIDPQDF